MKPKSRPKGLMAMKNGSKLPVKEILNDDVLQIRSLSQGHQSSKPSVQIVKCISFQKFRYSGENRPGKKYQEKEFMSLQLNNLADKVVRVVIICTDADNRELIHPNGLVGKDCHHGIYDKEYVVNKSCFQIKIPYLRTERIKINAKKDEQKTITQANNIQAVLSQRASHLPSPYKERCLSQCTDKYTSGRKFDTTKVCLGVIVTVQRQPGEHNGSLHAISHMVRNASEKTTLEILRLSQDAIPAWHGGVIDIFTNEDGPAIEPDKCLVYVTLNDVPGAEEWKSDVFSPSREDILYKKVIKYVIPPIAPNHDISTAVVATLHLECPQSNQYCYTQFNYTPLDSSQGYVCIENLSPGGLKRPLEELQVLEDVKPSYKKLKQELSKANNKTIKENLKTKLRTRLENGYSDDDIQEGDGHIGANGDGELYNTDHQFSQQEKALPRYAEEKHLFIRHEDPQTGEASYLLDMDANKANQSNHGSPFQPHSQDVKVVATGYSDAVPPNTTVLIYTSNNGVSGEVTISDAGAEHILVEDSALVQASHLAYRGKENRFGDTNKIVEVTSNPSSEQVVRRETIGQKSSEELHVTTKTVAPIKSQFHYGFQSSATSLTTNSDTFQSPSLSPASIKTPSAIPDIRRMVIPHKSMPETSPWEVGGSEDADAYSICAEAMGYTSHRGPSQLLAVKKNFVSVSSASHATEMKSSGQEADGRYTDENENTTDKTFNVAQQDGVIADQNSSNTSKPVGLNSYLDRAIVNNLPTFEVSQIAETFGEGIEHDIVDADVEDAP